MITISNTLKLKSGSKTFQNTQDLEMFKDELIKKVFSSAAKATASALSSSIPRKTGEMATAFLLEFETAIFNFLTTGRFIIDLTLIEPHYTQFNFKNLAEWEAFLLNKFSLEFNIQAEMMGAKTS